MSWLKKLFNKEASTSSAITAKERLQVILQHERSTTNDPEMLRKLQAEIMAVVAKYVQVDEDQVAVELGNKGDCSILELNVTFNQQAKAAS